MFQLKLQVPLLLFVTPVVWSVPFTVKRMSKAPMLVPRKVTIPPDGLTVIVGVDPLSPLGAVITSDATGGPIATPAEPKVAAMSSLCARPLTVHVTLAFTRFMSSGWPSLVPVDALSEHQGVPAACVP